MKETIKSPIYYMGNKEKLIKKGLIDLFPTNINTFIDLFCGSGTVSMNVKANYYILNDYNQNTIDLLKFFKNTSPNIITNQMQQIINNHHILKGYNKRSTSETKEYKELANTNYNNFRDFYNTIDDSIINLYILSYYSNNHNIRFNSSGKFNMPIGNQYYKPEVHDKKIYNGCNFLHNSNVLLLNKDYKNINLNILSKDDFVYIDPPYLNTLAIYNEQQGWNIDDDFELFDLCDKLTGNGIKWAMSNVYMNKGIANTHLIKWVETNNYNVHHFSDFTYVSCGKGNAKTDEVYICNYNI